MILVAFGCFDSHKIDYSDVVCPVICTSEIVSVARAQPSSTGPSIRAINLPRFLSFKLAESFGFGSPKSDFTHRNERAFGRRSPRILFVSTVRTDFDFV